MVTSNDSDIGLRISSEQCFFLQPCKHFLTINEHTGSGNNLALCTKLTADSLERTVLYATLFSEERPTYAKIHLLDAGND